MAREHRASSRTARLAVQGAVLALVAAGTSAFATHQVVGQGGEAVEIAAEAGEGPGLLRSVGRGSDAIVVSRAGARTALAGSALADAAPGLALVVDGELVPVPAGAVTVRDVLRDAGVVLDEYDSVSVDLDTPVEPGLTIDVVRASVRTVVDVIDVPHEQREVKDKTLARGTTVVEEAGQDGRIEETYVVVEADGVEIERTLLAAVVVAEPQDRVVRIGTLAPPRAPAVKPGTSKAIAKKLVEKRGWDEDEFACLVDLWQKESGWRVNAENTRTGAYGIPQAYPGSKMASEGSDWRTNPETQIKWGLKYIAGRYKTPCKAWAFFKERNWY